jgi:hypothetical protein
VKHCASKNETEDSIMKKLIASIYFAVLSQTALGVPYTEIETPPVAAPTFAEPIASIVFHAQN